MTSPIVNPFWFPTRPDTSSAPAQALWRQRMFDPYTALELVYLSALTAILDKPEWYIKKDREDVRSKWKKEITEYLEDAKVNTLSRRNAQVLDNNHFLSYLFSELDAIAAATGLNKRENHDDPPSAALTPLGPHGVYVSDNLIPEHIHRALLEQTEPLEARARANGQWHPDSNNQVLDLVHPSFYPLIYGQTPIAEHQLEGGSRAVFPDTIIELPIRNDLDGDISKAYQWIPSEVELSHLPDPKLKVKFTSYINNLNPHRYGALYKTIASVLSRFIPLFNYALQCCDPKAVPVRRIDAEMDNSAYQESRDDYDDKMWIKHKHGEAAWKEGMSWEERQGLIPEYNTEEWDEYMEFLDRENESEEENEDDDDQNAERRTISIPILPDEVNDPVTTAYTLHDRGPTPSDHLVFKPGFKFQVIVKLATIHLTPSNPTYAGGAWHLEGMENEAIACTGLYYYDMHNITPSKLTFRHTYKDDNFAYPQSDFRALEEVFGFENESSLNIQVLGSISARKGRCVTFPNFLQHKVEPFELEDKTQAGYRKILAFFLIHPDCRIASSRDIPPQETSWAGENLFYVLRRRIPLEVCQRIASFRVGAMTNKECEEHVKKLMTERKKFVNNDVWELRQIFLCEH
ncbi:hypothetical protein HDV05_001018 [Chytridiales sp. JEL 0842]|nr:hypothetical protein HDV05_001018 [Chytridiales sp. JEL 0842]